MKKVNVFFIWLILVLLPGGITAQAQSNIDYYVGDWEVAILDLPDGDIEITLRLEKVSEKLQGSFISDSGELRIDNIEEKETTITLYFVLGEYSLSMFLEKVDDNNIKGNLADAFFVSGKRVIK